MHGNYRRTYLQRHTLTTGHLLIVAGVVWALLGGWLSRFAGAGANTVRLRFLAAFAAIYFLRVAYGTYAFLVRSVEWSELLVVLPWMGLIHWTFAYAQRRERPLPSSRKGPIKR